MTAPSWDLALFWAVNAGWARPVLDPLMRAASSPAVLWVLAAAGALGALALGAGTRRVLAGALLVALAAGAADIGAGLVKTAAGRVRPLNALAGARYHDDGQWRVRPEGFAPQPGPGSSFPSAHAANSAAAGLAVFLMLGRGRRRWGVWLLPLAVGLSRVYLGKHYPTDVLAGWALGLAAGGLAWLLLARRLGLGRAGAGSRHVPPIPGVFL